MNDDLKQITEAMIDGEYTSLILFGSYGRGEGVFRNGKPVNDLDLILVDGTDKQKSRMEAIRTSVPLDVIGISSQDLADLVPTQMWWEMSKAHKVLAGKQIVFPYWEPWEIPYWDAIESLNKRSVSMLIAKHEMMKKQPDYYKVATQIFKMVIALGDAVLIKRGQFDYRYAVRSHMLLYDEIGELYRLAVSHKILGWPEFDPDQLWRIWNQTSNIFRDYVTMNQIHVPNADILLDVTERTKQEELANIIKQLGAERWL